jgi:hypothetical protein
MTKDELNIQLTNLGFVNCIWLKSPLYYRIEISESETYELIESKINKETRYRVVNIGERNSPLNDIAYDKFDEAALDYISRIIRFVIKKEKKT